MEPIEGVNNIPASRWKLTCYICKLRVGACIQCSNKACYTSFHVSCARRAKLFLQHSPIGAQFTPKSFCDRHLPDWYRVQHDVDRAFAEAQHYFATHSDSATQGVLGTGVSSRGKFVISLKRSKQSAVIPAIVLASIQIYMQKFRVRNKADFIADMCKYWSLKRRSRRGISLLKRLQMQVEDSASHNFDEEHRAKRLEFGKGLLNELDNSQRPLLEDVLEREMTKKERCEMRDAVLDQIYLPLQPILRSAVEAVRIFDTNKILESVSSVIQTRDDFASRMTWAKVLQNVTDAQYLSVSRFRTDLEQLIANIFELYPELVSKEHKFALRLQAKLHEVFRECELAETSRDLDVMNFRARCFDHDFEPEGLLITEERPFNWANRDASPLSDLDDEMIEQLGRSADPVLEVSHDLPATNGVEVEDKSSSARIKFPKRNVTPRVVHSQRTPTPSTRKSKGMTPQTPRAQKATDSSREAATPRVSPARDSLRSSARSSPRARNAPVTTPSGGKLPVPKSDRVSRSLSTQVLERTLPKTPVASLPSERSSLSTRSTDRVSRSASKDLPNSKRKSIEVETMSPKRPKRI